MKWTRLPLFLSLLGLFPANHLHAQWVQTLPSDRGIIRCFAVLGKTLFAGGNDAGVLRSTDGGRTWDTTGLTNKAVDALAVLDSTLFAGTLGDRIFRSTDNGVSWQRDTESIGPADVHALLVVDTLLFAGSYGAGIWKSADRGSNWAQVDAGLSGWGATLIHTITALGGDIYAGNDPGSVYKSTDRGQTWKSVLTLYHGDPTDYSDPVFALGVCEHTVLVGSVYSGILVSSDSGTTWAAANNGLPVVWPPIVIKALATTDSLAFAGTLHAGVFYSSNRGASWSAANDSFPGSAVYALAVIGDYVYAGPGSGGIWRRPLSDFVPAVAPGEPYLPLAAGNLWRYRATDGDPYVGWGVEKRIYDSLTFGGRLYWRVVPLRFSFRQPIDTVRLDSAGTLWWRHGTEEDPIFRFNAQVGEQWSYPDPHLSPAERRVVTYVGLMDSMRLPLGPLSSIVFQRVKVFHTDLPGYYDMWTDYYFAPGVGRIYAQHPQNFEVLYGATIGGETLGDTTLSSVGSVHEMPVALSLAQNYPNPFNPVTTIRYGLPHRSHVTLTIFNTLGQKVAELVNGEVEAGYHEVRFNAGKLAAGVYFYRLQAGPFVQAKSLLLLR